MSSYFDAVDQRISEVSNDDHHAAEKLEAIEQSLVFDCTVCSMLPEFPTGVRAMVHEAVIQHGVGTAPANAEPPDFETVDQHKNKLYQLSGDLHSAFHEAARSCVPGLSDNPRSLLYLRFSEGEEEREKLVAARDIVCACGHGRGLHRQRWDENGNMIDVWLCRYCSWSTGEEVRCECVKFEPVIHLVDLKLPVADILAAHREAVLAAHRKALLTSPALEILFPAKS